MDDDWRQRLGWAFDLVDESPERRRAAIEQLEQTHQAWADALRAHNTVWNKPEHPDYPALRAAYLRSGDHTLPQALWKWRTTSLAEWPGLPYALLMLRWEALYPDEWMAHTTSYGTKINTLRNLAREAADLPPEVLAELEDLVMLAVGRTYRCEDARYARLARAIASPRLRERLVEASGSADAGTRRRAGYLLWLIDDPTLPHPKRDQWQAYLDRVS